MNRRNKGRNRRPTSAKKNDNKTTQHADVESVPPPPAVYFYPDKLLENHDFQNQREMRHEISESHSSKCDHDGNMMNERTKQTFQCDSYIMSLPDDVLFLIFSFLDHKDLCRLCQVCRRFNYISSKDCAWLCHAERMVLVQFLQNRRSCSLKEKCRIAPHWQDGKFKDHFIAKHKIRHIPWIQKEDQDIWFSSGNIIRCFNCQPGRRFMREDTSRRLLGLEQDATRYVVKNDMIIAGVSDGSVHGWKSSGKSLFHHKHLHQSDTHCVDFTDRCIVSGSKDGTCKVIPLEVPDRSDGLDVRSFNAGERVWCLQCSPCQSFFVAGLAGYLDHPPLIKWDIESGECLGRLSSNSWRGAGVLHMKFESANELLTCGYDTFIRLWDLRTNTCVAQWEEPYDSSLYCLETDKMNAFAVGTARHGMVRLWDKRKTEPVQMYYSADCTSPVYSLTMDYGHLYLALDMGLRVMDFTGGF